MKADASLTQPLPEEVFVIDLIDDQLGLADVEDNAGRTYQLPVHWLPGAEDGAAYHVNVTPCGVTFTPAPDGARLLRERSKQTLLDFHDDPEENA